MPDNAPMIGDPALPAGRRDRAGGWVATLPLETRDASAFGGLADETLVVPPTLPDSARPFAVFENASMGEATGTDGAGIAFQENPMSPAGSDMDGPGTVSADSSPAEAIKAPTAEFLNAGPAGH